MPRINITRDNVNPITSTGEPGFSPDTSAFGEMINDLERRKQSILAISEAEKDAYDSMFTTNKLVEASEKLYNLDQNYQQFLGSPHEELMGRANKDAEGVINDIISSAPDRKTKQFLMQQLAGSKQSFLNRLSVDNRKTLANNLRLDITKNIQSLSSQVARDPERFEEAVQHSKLLGESAKTFLTPDELAALTVENENILLSSLARGLLNTDVRSAEAALNDGVFDSLGGNFVSRMQGDIDNHKERVAREAEAAQSRRSQEIYMNLRLGMREGTANYEDIRAAYDSGAISINHYISAWDEYENIEKSKSSDSVDVELVEGIVRGGLLPDPYDKDTKEAVDKFFNQRVLPMIAQDPSKSNSIILDFLDQIKGVIPKTLSSNISANLFTGAPDRQVLAAELFMNISSKYPSIYDQVPNRVAAKASNIVSGLEAGLSPEEAVKSAEVQVFEKNTAPYKARLEDFEQQEISFDKDKFDPGIFSSEPEVPTQAVMEWENLVKRFNVDYGMDLGKAEQEAYKRISSRWGSSSVGGDGSEGVFMKYAPETMYGIPGTDNSWIREQLVSEMFEGVDKKDVERLSKAITITPHPDTLTSPKGVGYIVGYIDPDDGRIVLKEGVWRPSRSESKVYRELRQEAINKKSREFRRINRLRENEMKGVIKIPQAVDLLGGLLPE